MKPPRDEYWPPDEASWTQAQQDLQDQHEQEVSELSKPESTPQVTFSLSVPLPPARQP